MQVELARHHEDVKQALLGDKDHESKLGATESKALITHDDLHDLGVPLSTVRLRLLLARHEEPMPSTGGGRMRTASTMSTTSSAIR